MSVLFIGDPHLGHRNIHLFRPFVKDSDHNSKLIIDDWRKNVTKRHLVFVMGDAAFSKDALDDLGNLPGRKILIKGNHDDLVTTRDQLNVFEEIHGMLKYKKMWLTHCPMHPNELFSKPNIHGHVHMNTIMKPLEILDFPPTPEPDPRYLNCCVDVVWPEYGTCFLPLDFVKRKFNID